MSKTVTANDFKPINIWIWVCNIDGHEFIYQVPLKGDTRRLAQTSRLLIHSLPYGCNGGAPRAPGDRRRTMNTYEVRDLDEALTIANSILASGEPRQR